MTLLLNSKFLIYDELKHLGSSFSELKECKSFVIAHKELILKSKYKRLLKVANDILFISKDIDNSYSAQLVECSDSPMEKSFSILD